MFRMNGYVQDERYIAGEHMDVRRDCVSFALHHMDVQREASRGSHKCLVRFKLSSGGAGFCVQDVRYVAGAWMHRSAHLQTGCFGSQAQS